MRTRTLLACSICCAAFVAAYSHGEEKKPETGLNGLWATDAVATASVKKKSDLGRPPDSRGTDLVLRLPEALWERRSGPDGPALMMELKASESKLTGKITDLADGTKLDIEEGKPTGKRFEFVTSKKAANAKTRRTFLRANTSL